jgi:hypothetical protein
MEAKGLGMGRGAGAAPPLALGAEDEPEADAIGMPGRVLVGVGVGLAAVMVMVGMGIAVMPGCAAVVAAVAGWVAVGTAVSVTGGGGSSSFLEQATSAGPRARSNNEQIRSVVRMGAKLALPARPDHGFLVA